MSRVKALGNGNLDGMKKRRKGQHSKKTSNNKGSKNYKKPYNRQGR
jgi:hypothetical protein